MWPCYKEKTRRRRRDIERDSGSCSALFVGEHEQNMNGKFVIDDKALKMFRS